MNEVAGSGRTFILPVTAATQYRQVDMTHMPELRRSLDAQLDLPLLTAEQKEAAVMGLARKVAAANGRTAPATIPAAVTKLLGFAGSTPGELTYVMEGFGDYWWRGDDGWRKGMHSHSSFSCYCLPMIHYTMQVYWHVCALHQMYVVRLSESDW